MTEEREVVTIRNIADFEEVRIWGSQGEIVDGDQVVLTLAVGNSEAEFNLLGAQALIRQMTELSRVRHIYSADSGQEEVCLSETYVGDTLSTATGPGPLCPKCRVAVMDKWLR